MAARMVSDQSCSRIKRQHKLLPRNLMATTSVNDMLRSPSFLMAITSDSMDRLVVVLTMDKQSSCLSTLDPTTRSVPWWCVAYPTRSKWLTLSSFLEGMAALPISACSSRNLMANERVPPSSSLIPRRTHRQPRISSTRRTLVLKAGMSNFMIRTTSSWKKSATCIPRVISVERVREQ